MIQECTSDLIAPALSRLEKILREDGSQEAADKEWFALAKQIGAKMVSVPLEKLIDSLRAILAAASYDAKHLKLGDTNLVAHNNEIAERLKASYSLEQFQALFDFCWQHGVFSIKIDERTGLVQTSAVEENWEMSARQWVTDTVRCGDIERVVQPDAWHRALITLADFYGQSEELDAIEAAVKDPNYYRVGGLTNGVAHIFMPSSLKRDESWFNNKRLESHALALSAFCRAILPEQDADALKVFDNIHSGTGGEAVTGGQAVASGHKGLLPLLTDPTLRLKVINAISNLAAYLKAINTNPDSGAFDFAAPSAGPWEEVPFPDGLTWDTVATLEAFANLRELIFADKCSNNEQIDIIRSEIIATKYGAWLQGAGELDRFLAFGYDKVRMRLLTGSQPIEHPFRPFDSSSAFVATSSIKLGMTALEDAANHCRVLDSLERHLVRDNGMIRYAPFKLPAENGTGELVFDSYLADNYWLAPPLRAALTGQLQVASQEFGSEDCSTPEAYLARVKLARPDKEAQWCWVSVMAEGYARQVVKLYKATQGGSLTVDEKSLADHALNKASEFINRSYARVTGQSQSDSISYKSNGKQCPAFAVPEAYEHVGSIGDKDTKLLPGVNTPLAWGIASLFSASQWFAYALQLANPKSS
jgi:hypothetical protein